MRWGREEKNEMLGNLTLPFQPFQLSFLRNACMVLPGMTYYETQDCAKKKSVECVLDKLFEVEITWMSFMGDDHTCVVVRRKAPSLDIIM